MRKKIQDMDISELAERGAELVKDLGEVDTVISELEPKLIEAGMEYGAAQAESAEETPDQAEVLHLVYMQLATKAYELTKERDDIKRVLLQVTEEIKKREAGELPVTDQPADTWKVYDATDALNHESPVYVRIEGKEIVFIDQNYWIEMSRIRTRAALLEWVHHMCGKSWTNLEMIEQFIELVHEYRKWELFRGV